MFRDSLTNIGRELESDVLPLLVKTSNNRNVHGNHRDCFILNPSAKSPTQLEMFKFLGALIGYGIMAKAALPLNLAPTFWKTLQGETLTLNDLDSIDAYSC